MGSGKHGNTRTRACVGMKTSVRNASTTLLAPTARPTHPRGWPSIVRPRSRWPPGGRWRGLPP
eukprot:3457365-Lingulodinium_polyedra.AAC.1